MRESPQEGGHRGRERTLRLGRAIRTSLKWDRKRRVEAAET